MLFASVVQVGVLLMFVTKPFSLSCGSCVILMPLLFADSSVLGCEAVQRSVAEISFEKKF